jgi:hypothetical protein
MKKIIFLILLGSFCIVSCSEKATGPSKLEQIANQVELTDQLYNVVASYTAGDTIELLVKGKDGKYALDKAALSAMNVNERAVSYFGFLMYLFPTTTDSVSVPKFFCGQDFPNSAWVGYCNATAEEDVMYTKELLKSNSRSKTVGAPSVVGEKMTLIRKSKMLVLEIEKIYEGEVVKDLYNFENGEKIKLLR